MKEIEYSVFINKPVEEVFSFVEDLSNKPEWEPGVESAKVVEGEYQKEGAIIQVNSRILGKRIEAIAKVVQYEENKVVSCRATKPFIHEISNIYEPVKEGTKFTRRGVADKKSAGNFFKVGSPLIAKMLERTFKKTADNVKDILERK